MLTYELPSIKKLFSEVLAEKPDSYIIDEIFTMFPSVTELMNATELELTSIKGIGKVRARRIIAALQLAKRLNAPVVGDRHIIRSPQDAAKILTPQMRYLQQEHFVVLFLNTKNHLIGEPVTISIGSLNAAIVTPQMVFRAAVKRSAASIIACHNHPSGDPSPSSEDIQLTARLVDAGNIMGIEILDHIIVGSENFVSLKERGLMGS